LDAILVRGKGYFGEEKHERRKGHLEGKAACVSEEGEACMQGRPNDARFMLALDQFLGISWSC
jgi:hypothetical protein